jgi:hypothetical protein
MERCLGPIILRSEFYIHIKYPDTLANKRIGCYPTM